MLFIAQSYNDPIEQSLFLLKIKTMLYRTLLLAPMLFFLASFSNVSFGQRAEGISSEKFMIFFNKDKERILSIIDDKHPISEAQYALINQDLKEMTNDMPKRIVFKNGDGRKIRMQFYAMLSKHLTADQKKLHPFINNL